MKILNLTSFVIQDQWSYNKKTIENVIIIMKKNEQLNQIVTLWSKLIKQTDNWAIKNLIRKYLKQICHVIMCKHQTHQWVDQIR